MELTFIVTHSVWTLSSHLAIYLSCFAFVEHFQLLQHAGECNSTSMQLDRAQRCHANRKMQFRYSQSICHKWIREPWRFWYRFYEPMLIKTWSNIKMLIFPYALEIHPYHNALLKICHEISLLFFLLYLQGSASLKSNSCPCSLYQYLQSWKN